MLGIVGQVSQMGRSFSWTGTRGQRRDLEVAVSVCGGRTRVIVQENLSNLIGGIFGGMGGGGMGLLSAILGTLGAPTLLPVVVPLWIVTTFATARTAYHYNVKRRAQELEQLADRLSALAKELAPAAASAARPGAQAAGLSYGLVVPLSSSAIHPAS